MKFKLLLLLAIISFISCNENDEPIVIGGKSFEIWNLKSAGVNSDIINYKEGDVIWKFMNNTKILEVKNNITTTGPENIYSGLATGRYNYNEQIENGKEYLLIDIKNDGNLKEYGIFTKKGKNLIISFEGVKRVFVKKSNK